MKSKCHGAFAVLLVFLSLSGCATLRAQKYSQDVDQSLQDIRVGKFQEAAERLRPLAEKEDDDQLMHLFDYGTLLQLAGDYKKSSEVFLKADKMSEVKDYHSLTRITGSILLNEGMVQYKGEDYEKVLINAYLAINYLMSGDFDDAVVETRRLNEKLIKYKNDAKREYEQNPFARYLSAIIWEADQKWDDAFIDYTEAYRLNPAIPGLKMAILHAAKRAGRDDFPEWKKKFPDVRYDSSWDDPKMGELVVIYQQGMGPAKGPHPEWNRIPKLYPRFRRGQFAKVEIDDQGSTISEPVFSVQETSIKTLDDQYAGLIAKRIGGVVAKAVVADQIRQKNETLGQLAWIGMNLADQADLRQWLTLPQAFHIARYRLKAGTYKVHVSALDVSRNPTGEHMAEQTVTIKPRAKAFINWRSFF